MVQPATTSAAGSDRLPIAGRLANAAMPNGSSAIARYIPRSSPRRIASRNRSAMTTLTGKSCTRISGSGWPGRSDPAMIGTSPSHGDAAGADELPLASRARACPAVPAARKASARNTAVPGAGERRARRRVTFRASRFGEFLEDGVCDRSAARLRGQVTSFPPPQPPRSGSCSTASSCPPRPPACTGWPTRSSTPSTSCSSGTMPSPSASSSSCSRRRTPCAPPCCAVSGCAVAGASRGGRGSSTTCRGTPPAGSS